MMSAEEAEEGDRIESFLGGSLKDGTDQSQLSRFFVFAPAHGVVDWWWVARLMTP